MTGKVFISCGQKNEHEKSTAKEIEAWLKSEGFTPYVAITTQSIEDINSGIIANLKNSDYYVFVDFPREPLDEKKYRGSLFTHQELAIAYYLGFERVLFLKHEDNILEGLLRYIGGNAIRFNDNTDIVSIIKKEFIARNWTSTFTRQLIPQNLVWNGIVNYTDHVGNHYQGRALAVDIKNERSDTAAFNTIAKLQFIEHLGEKKACEDKSLLKVNGQSGFSQVIWPTEHGAFDLLLMDRQNPKLIFLLSALDLRDKSPIITDTGEYFLYYSVISENMPPTNFKVKLEVTGDISNPPIELINE